MQTEICSDMDVLFHRLAADRVSAALEDTPVVMVIGPRQRGKTTQVRDLVAGERAYTTLDDDTVLESAREDPQDSCAASIRSRSTKCGGRRTSCMRLSDLSVDRDRRPGRFLLTGSANVLTLPTVSESLAGRLEVATLLPLSRAETRGRRPQFVRKAFTGTLVKAPE